MVQEKYLFMYNFTFKPNGFFILVSFLLFGCDYGASYSRMKEEVIIEKKSSQNISELRINQLDHALVTEEFVDNVQYDVSDESEYGEGLEEQKNLCTICSQIILESNNGFTRCCNAKVHKDCAYNYVLDTNSKYLVCPNDNCSKGFNFPIDLEVSYGKEINFRVGIQRYIENIFKDSDLGVREASCCERIKNYIEKRGIWNILLNRGSRVCCAQTLEESDMPSGFGLGLLSSVKTAFISPVSCILSGLGFGYAFLINSSIKYLSGVWCSLLTCSILDLCMDFCYNFPEINGNLIKDFQDGSKEYCSRLWNKTEDTRYKRALSDEIVPLLQFGNSEGHLYTQESL